MIFPFLFWGHDTGHGSYFGFFPFGGRLKGVLGQDEIDFALFPLYWSTENEGRRSLNVLWPFFNRVSGERWSGWRLWPFYGAYETRTSAGELRSDTRFALWPFWIHRRDQMDWRPSEVFFSFPFYGVRRSAKFESHTYLWPFFQTRVDRESGERTYAGFLFPWRLEDQQVDLWPIVGSKTESSVGRAGLTRRYRHFVLWPFERYQWRSDERREETAFWLLPLMWHFHRIDPDTFQTEEEWKIWPLAEYRRDAIPGGHDAADQNVGERVSFNFPSPLWFRTEPFRRHYSRWFHLFRYRSRADFFGWELLYGAVSYRSDPIQREKAFSLFGGLLEIGTREEAAAFRLLWIPWW